MRFGLSQATFFKVPVDKNPLQAIWMWFENQEREA